MALSAACGGDPEKDDSSPSAALDAAASLLDGGLDMLPDDLPDDGGDDPLADPVNTPIDGLSQRELVVFASGNDLFSLSLRDQDGVGPLYIRNDCDGCHAKALRGPGLIQTMSLVEADRVTPTADQSRLDFGHTVVPLLAAGATIPILPPESQDVRVSLRVGAPILGRGYLEAVLDSEIERVAEEQSSRDDAIRGRVNHVLYGSESNSDTSYHAHQKGDMVIGRFGLKARIATLDDFCADSLSNYMGLTSPMRPTEILNPDGLKDDLKPGVDLSIDSVNARADYTRRVAIPLRRPGTETGRAVFDRILCSVCHVATLHTRADYPIASLADIDAPIYSDLLLHDMGDGLADSLDEGDGEAGPRDWRTAPLIGLRFLKTYLHDGRAPAIERAIEEHASSGSEASDSVASFRALSFADRQDLLAFVATL